MDDKKPTPTQYQYTTCSPSKVLNFIGPLQRFRKL
jgi:hypothetical protein